MAATTATIRENNKLLTATTLAKFIQYKNAALPASRSPTKVQSPQTVCVFCSFRFVSLKLNKMRIAAKANAKRKLIFFTKAGDDCKKTIKRILTSLSLSLYVRMKESYRVGCGHVREKYEDIKGSVAAALTNTENYQ